MSKIRIVATGRGIGTGGVGSEKGSADRSVVYTSRSGGTSAGDNCWSGYDHEGPVSSGYRTSMSGQRRAIRRRDCDDVRDALERDTFVSVVPSMDLFRRAGNGVGKCCVRDLAALVTLCVLVVACLVTSAEGSTTSERIWGHNVPPKAISWDGKSKRSHYGDYWTYSGHANPTFDNSSPRNITTQLGQTVYLHCIVNNLGDKIVTWIRRKDLHVLTVGLDTYIADSRFQAIHMERSNDWALQIKYAQLKDEGLYECQVSSDPKISIFVHLRVLVAKADIEGNSPLFLKTGSSINLTCIISQSPEPPVFVFWYHNDRMINYDDAKGVISLQKAGKDKAISRLYIRNALPSDSGNYTCGPSNADPTSVTVYVLNGEKPAAIQHDANTSSSSGTVSEKTSAQLLFFLMLVLRALLQR